MSTPPAASAASTSAVGGLLGVRRAPGRARICCVLDQVGEPVGADQQPVPEAYVDQADVRDRRVLGLEGLEDDVLAGVPAGLARG